ncbi:hypothetical protein [Streptomyces sp. ST2-7A]|uniref:hypothetical protein n=1 Tax=Streptomyces sp. ST2-7A TaxID=2907214 RepID=UPI001F189F8A|nr:hypothetical protein [Streptomyces sp. ST2-7A]MCE7082063.1 hypothetical protein [Streptomyces sp. ST2-7A]
MGEEHDGLPRVDERLTVVGAAPEEVLRALEETLERSFGRPAATRYAALVGCAERTAGGPRPFVEGSTLPGFRVARVVADREVVLTGRHRFSTYALLFRIEPLGPGRSRLRAETRAVFPGPTGRAYRLAVIRGGGHAVGVRRLLAAVRRRAEAGRPPGAG